MKKLAVIFTLLLLASVSGGCAVVPAIITTGASFAVPQTASLAISAVGTVHKTALVAADERQVDEMISDKMATIQAEAVLLVEQGVDMEATCLNGDLYVVGEYATPENRDSAIKALEGINGVNAVKGVVKPMPSSLAALIEPTITDKHAETVINSGIIKELHIKSANVDVNVVQGEAVITGVVADAEEAASVVRLIEDLKPDNRKPIKVTSLLVQQDMFEAGLPQTNNIYALSNHLPVLADAQPVEKAESVESEVVTEQFSVTVPNKPEITTLAVKLPAALTPWQKARLKMKHRILSLAKGETDAKTRRELITLSTQVRKDTFFSIEGRLARTMYYTSNLRLRQHVTNILSEIAPHRVTKVATVAMQ